MTEAGQKWLRSRDPSSEMHWDEAADFWVRAFCDEVDRRADKYDDPDAVWMAYEALKRELLGGRDDE